MQDWISHGLAELPEEQRLTLEMAYFLGYSCEEIAAITGSPVGTIKARMFHAREKLRLSLPSLGGLAPRSPHMNHKHAWELIPWYVNGTVSDSKRDSLQFHLEHCSQCRERGGGAARADAGHEDPPAGRESCRMPRCRS